MEEKENFQDMHQELQEYYLDQNGDSVFDSWSPFLGNTKRNKKNMKHIKCERENWNFNLVKLICKDGKKREKKHK